MEQRERNGYTKIKITIEKDADKWASKQRRNEMQRKFENEREQINQRRKHDRIEALKDRRKTYEQTEPVKGEGQAQV